MTVIRDTAGRYFASFVVESTADPLPEQSAQVGIARGTGTVAVLSNGATIALPYRAKAPSRRTRSNDDDSWIVLARMLDQKAARYGRRFGKVSPSPVPGPHHPDRAARTILAAGQAESRNACGADKRPGPVPALGHETGTRRRRYPRQTESSLPAGARHEDAKTRTATHR
ncbi:hypothetical protein [Nocardia brasiliensis]|uniref:hypothetical protein n=1 Tax=Nocardia brasiliensis TaxID=37326 RepID=UPI0018958989|nr:hypothetical protein [Nocardia brasiliensis]MBF6548669.1 hypothetical protein [Nocardia brasiliensis]